MIGFFIQKFTRLTPDHFQFCLPTLGPIHPVKQQKFFNCSLGSYLHEFRLLPTYKMPNLEDIEFPLDVDFVSASSENHFNLSRGMIKRMREVHPTNKIIFYDLGLTARQVEFCSWFCAGIFEWYCFCSKPYKDLIFRIRNLNVLFFRLKTDHIQLFVIRMYLFRLKPDQY